MSNRSIFYGWWVVAAFSVTTFISTGIRHAVGPFLKPMVADLHLDRASFSLVIAVSLFLYGVFMPIAGMLLDRFSVRVVASVGTVLLAISLVMTAMVRDFWEFAAVYGVLVPLGLAGTGPVIASGVVARWFSKRRGTALSVLGSASMTGMSLLVPAVTWLIITTGWRMTYVVIAGAMLVVLLPLCLWVLRDSPESVGLLPDGGTARPDTVAAPVERVTASEALQTLAFWQLAGSFFTCGFSMSLLSAHGIPMLTDHGYTPMFASWTMGGLGPRLLAGRPAVRDDGRLRRGVRAGVLLPGGRIDRGAQHRQGRAADLAGRYRLGHNGLTKNGGLMLNPGDKAPDFVGRDHNGQTVKLADFKGKAVVLWFFPKADTPG